MITRLEEKGWLSCDEDGHAFRYRAVLPREATLGTMIRRLVDTTFGGSAEGLVMALLHGRGVSKEEARRIKTLIDRRRARPDESPRRPGSGRGRDPHGPERLRRVRS